MYPNVPVMFRFVSSLGFLMGAGEACSFLFNLKSQLGLENAYLKVDNSRGSQEVTLSELSQERGGPDRHTGLANRMQTVLVVFNSSGSASLVTSL